MDDKNFIAEYAANEIIRINERIREMIESENTPSDEFRNEVITDIENTLERLRKAVSYVIETTDEDNDNADNKYN
ncbi:MAG: hypothetical protein R3D71_01115 [Rickettsiales bacterium]